MFTQTIRALASAVDKKDPYTSNHSKNVQEIAVTIGRQMGCSEAEIEALEWGGLLHDIGKIGVSDAVLLKPERLNKEERIQMNMHPVLGADIIMEVERLKPELPIIRHHHEWYNGSGYPDHLVGEAIPKLARILHVADAFEAMTAARPYRLQPLTTGAGPPGVAALRGDPVRPDRARCLRPHRLGAQRGRPRPATGRSAADPPARPGRGRACRSGGHSPPGAAYTRRDRAPWGSDPRRTAGSGASSSRHDHARVSRMGPTDSRASQRTRKAGVALTKELTETPAAATSLGRVPGPPAVCTRRRLCVCHEGRRRTSGGSRGSGQAS